MEIIQLSGYTEFEKLNIAVKYLVPRQTQGVRPRRRAVHDHRERDPHDHPPLHEGGGRPLARARDRQHLPQGGAPGGRPRARRSRSRSSPRTSRSTSACRSSGVGKKEEHDEIGLTNGLSVTSNGGGELLACEVAVVAGQGQARHHRPAREGDGGERAGGDELRALARRGARARAGFLPEGRRARSLPRVRPQGRAERRRDDGDEPGERAHQGAGEARPGDDGRDHAARPGDAHRRPEGEAPRGAPRAASRRSSSRRRTGRTCARCRGACSRRRASCSSSTWTRCCARRCASPTPNALFGPPRETHGVPRRRARRHPGAPPAAATAREGDGPASPGAGEPAAPAPASRPASSCEAHDASVRFP